ncbi:MAG: MarR family transcriptional regulator [Lutibacter sp.]|uniref:MarR family winged helix-turn-helix transcriptional regulator n=1 Tax=Lutibacter sp. TaxID=1925666 RepID=UPI0017F19273|nr:MarR family transcriptional regulator [Lutibacter sp.]MBT8317460.1 MarR family transcriptional regulator [Lutibacter sp.]NNJ58319.1 MarR family transcriptional regulator [Lutibacter sp.]
MTFIDILIKLRKIVRSVNLESKRVEKEQGVSIPQLLCLQYLAEQEDYRTNAAKLKTFLNLNASTISGILRRLERKGFVAKLPNASDKRVTLISLTTVGLELLQNAPITFQQKLSKKLQALPPEKLQTIIDGIDILTNIMEVEELDASPIITSEEFSKE